MKQRVMTALIAMPIVLAALCYRDTLPLAILLILVSIVALRELGAICRVDFRVAWIASAVTGTGIVIFAASSVHDVIQSTPVWTYVVLALVPIAGSILLQFVSKFLWGLAALSWIGIPIVTLMLFKSSLSDSSAAMFASTAILLPILPLWAGDTAAIFAGRAFGKYLMAPKISPKKTWEGGVANLLACIACAAALAPITNTKMLPALLCGMLCGTLGQVGDLLESAIKRKFDAKDSGTILPGHGGILDRIDSLLLSAVPCIAVLILLK